MNLTLHIGHHEIDNQHAELAELLAQHYPQFSGETK